MAKQRAEHILRRLGRNVAEARKARGLTQEQLAEIYPCLPQYVQRIEGGRANLTVRSMVKLANLLEVPVHELLRPHEGR